MNFDAGSAKRFLKSCFFRFLKNEKFSVPTAAQTRLKNLCPFSAEHSAAPPRRNVPHVPPPPAAPEPTEFCGSVPQPGVFSSAPLKPVSDMSLSSHPIPHQLFSFIFCVPFTDVFSQGWGFIFSLPKDV
jgi:hypothetical protein